MQKITNNSTWLPAGRLGQIDSAAVSIFVVILVELTNTVFFNSPNITTNTDTAALSTQELKGDFCSCSPVLDK